MHRVEAFIFFICFYHLCTLQWAEVLSADAFSAFEDAGLNDEKVLWLFIIAFIYHVIANKILFIYMQLIAVKERVLLTLVS